MTSSQVVILCIMIGYLVLNVTIGMIMSKRQERASTMSQEKKYFIGSRGMNGLVLAMTTMATYTSVSSFISAASGGASDPEYRRGAGRYRGAAEKGLGAAAVKEWMALAMVSAGIPRISAAAKAARAFRMLCLPRT